MRSFSSPAAFSVKVTATICSMRARPLASTFRIRATSSVVLPVPAAPGERACAWCDFLPVCGPDEPRRVSNKPPDKLGDLEALRERP